MQKIGFTEALDSIVASDPRYQREAYIFLRDALDFTTKQQKKLKGAAVRHVAVLLQRVPPEQGAASVAADHRAAHPQDAGDAQGGAIHRHAR